MEKLSSLVFALASLEPLLEQVFIVAVRPGAQRVDASVSELPAVGVDEHRDQSVVFARQLVDLLHDLIYSLLKRFLGFFIPQEGRRCHERINVQMLNSVVRVNQSTNSDLLTFTNLVMNTFVLLISPRTILVNVA